MTPNGLGNAVFEYQWLADDTEVAGATSSTYTPVEADVGKTIKVRVSFTDGGGNPESLTSTATAPGDPAADETGPPGPIWSAILTVGRIGGNYGYQSFLNPRAGLAHPGLVRSGRRYLHRWQHPDGGGLLYGFWRGPGVAGRLHA